MVKAFIGENYKLGSQMTGLTHYLVHEHYCRPTKSAKAGQKNNAHDFNNYYP